MRIGTLPRLDPYFVDTQKLTSGELHLDGRALDPLRPDVEDFPVREPDLVNDAECWSWASGSVWIAVHFALGWRLIGSNAKAQVVLPWR